MLKRTSTTQVFTLVCAIALLIVQAFGGVAGYLCRCGGQQVLTQVDHCHGPHSESCHGEQREVLDDAQSHAHESESDTENHEPLRSHIQLVQASEFEFQAPVIVLIAEILEPSLNGFLNPEACLTAWWKNVSSTPPQSVVIGRTVVLLI